MSEKKENQKNPITAELKLTDKHLDILAAALEFYMRWNIGQVWYLPNPLQGRYWSLKHDPDGERLRQAQQLMQKVLFPENVWNQSYGVGWNEKQEQQAAQIAYELETIIKAFQGRARYDEPLHYSNEELAEIKKTD